MLARMKNLNDQLDRYCSYCSRLEKQERANFEILQSNSNLAPLRLINAFLEYQKVKLWLGAQR